MTHSLQLLALVLLSTIFISCLRGNDYVIDYGNTDERLIIEIEKVDSMMVCSFSTDSIKDGGRITFVKRPRDVIPVVVYYVAPDSIFYLNDNIIESQSQGLNIIAVDKPDNITVERDIVKTQTSTGYSIDTLYTLKMPTDTLYTLITPTDTLHVESPSFFTERTYCVHIYNDEIYVWDSDGNGITPKPNFLRLRYFLNPASYLLYF